MNNVDKINKFYNDIKKEARVKSKLDSCIICGEKCTSFCNSHSMPRFILKNIAPDGKLINNKDLYDIDLGKTISGINNTWTFQNICNHCDKNYFENYEKESALLNAPTNEIMAEIALKNHLFMLYKYSIDKERHIIFKQMGMYDNKRVDYSQQDKVNLRDSLFNIRRVKKIIDKHLKSGFKIIYSKLLDRVVPLCVQTQICMEYDLHCTVINDVFDLSEKLRMEYIHLCVFPLKSKTYVLLFYHKDDRKYVNFIKQFDRLNEDDKLIFINYMIFRYVEHFVLSPKIDKTILANEKLKELSQFDVRLYRTWCNINITPDDIPNILDISI